MSDKALFQCSNNRRCCSPSPTDLVGDTAVCANCATCASATDMNWTDGGLAVCDACVERGVTNLTPRDAAEIYTQAALDKSLNGDRRGAATLLQRSLAFAVTAQALAALARQKKDPREAEVLLRKALAQDGTEWSAVANMTRVLAAQRRYSEALAWLDSHPYPDPLEQRMVRARLLRSMGREEDAGLEYRRVLAAACDCCKSEFRAAWRRRRWVW